MIGKFANYNDQRMQKALLCCGRSVQRCPHAHCMSTTSTYQSLLPYRSNVLPLTYVGYVVRCVGCLLFRPTCVLCVLQSVALMHFECKPFLTTLLPSIGVVKLFTSFNLYIISIIECSDGDMQLEFELY
ncbi:conserved hypothetical protein [Trichinella spiralis]|uniref:hypothetical protein n=1 Tax=Trichinella spiralis TaxID=6334 RepID=UPI0001EFDC77|nr:conserved hypothetical protein [Trichinella spiralis]